MIHLNANIMLLALTVAEDPKVRIMNDQASDLFRRVAEGVDLVTTSESVIAEVAYVLTSKANYSLNVDDAITRIAALVRLEGFRLADKDIVLAALDLWSNHPRIGFVDAITIVHTRHAGSILATFDRHFDAIPDIVRWQPVALTDRNGIANAIPGGDTERSHAGHKPEDERKSHE